MKIILVTGGNRGIGLAIAKELSVLGHQVIAGCRNPEEGKEALLGHDNIKVLSLDVTNPESIESLVNQVSQEYGLLDVLINNAGIISTSANAREGPVKETKLIMETNFYGAWQMAVKSIPLLKASTDGQIINISSGMGSLDSLTGGYAGYRLSKSSLNALTLLLANELEGKVRVNAMCPGWVRSEMGGQQAPRSLEQGADTAVWLSTEERSATAKFFRDRKEIPW